MSYLDITAEEAARLSPSIIKHVESVYLRNIQGKIEKRPRSHSDLRLKVPAHKFGEELPSIETVLREFDVLLNAIDRRTPTPNNFQLSENQKLAREEFYGEGKDGRNGEREGRQLRVCGDNSMPIVSLEDALRAYRANNEVVSLTDPLKGQSFVQYKNNVRIIEGAELEALQRSLIEESPHFVSTTDAIASHISTLCENGLALDSMADKPPTQELANHERLQMPSDSQLAFFSNNAEARQTASSLAGCQQAFNVVSAQPSERNSIRKIGSADLKALQKYLIDTAETLDQAKQTPSSFATELSDTAAEADTADMHFAHKIFKKPDLEWMTGGNKPTLEASLDRKRDVADAFNLQEAYDEEESHNCSTSSSSLASAEQSYCSEKLQNLTLGSKGVLNKISEDDLESVLSAEWEAVHLASPRAAKLVKEKHSVHTVGAILRRRSSFQDLGTYFNFFDNLDISVTSTPYQRDLRHLPQIPDLRAMFSSNSSIKHYLFHVEIRRLQNQYTLNANSSTEEFGETIVQRHRSKSLSSLIVERETAESGILDLFTEDFIPFLENTDRNIDERADSEASSIYGSDGFYKGSSEGRQ